jgi:hypothetical protein
MATNDHLHEKDDASTEAVGQNAERQAHQRTGQNRRGDQQTEFRFVQIELLFNPDADDRKHGPHGEIHREGQGIHRQHRDLFLLKRRSHCEPRFSAASAILRCPRRPILELSHWFLSPK